MQKKKLFRDFPVSTSLRVPYSLYSILLPDLLACTWLNLNLEGFCESSLVFAQPGVRVELPLEYVQQLMHVCKELGVHRNEKDWARNFVNSFVRCSHLAALAASLGWFLIR